MIKNLFIPYELAKKLKEKGFDEPCLACYVMDEKSAMDDTEDKFNLHYGLPFETKQESYLTLAPIYHQAIDWFREKHNLVVTPLKSFDGTVPGFSYCVTGRDGLIRATAYSKLEYYECLNEGFKHALALI